MFSARTYRRLPVLASACLFAVALGGCQRRLDAEQYGEVLDRLPYVPGVEQPYPLPQLDEPEPQPDTEAK